MAQIKSGDSANLLSIETNGAARTTLYGPTGSTISPSAPLAVREASADLGPSYSVNFDVLPVTALTDGTTYFTLHNAGPLTAYVRRITFGQGFVGTNAASRSTFRIERYSFTGTPSGGNTGISKKDPNAATTLLQATAANAGISTTGVTFEAGGFYRCACPNQVTAALAQTIDVGTREAAAIYLPPGMGLAIRAAGTILAGAYLTGSIGWHER